MARVAKPTKATKPAAGKRKPGRPSAQAAKPASKATKAAKPTKAAAAPKRASAVAAPAPKLNVTELRAYVEKLERSLATLRAKNREAGRAAKADAARIAELEQHVARREAKAAPSPAAAESDPKPAPAVRAKRQSRKLDPGDAVPSGVAVAEPAPLDAEAEAVREKLEYLAGE